MTDETPRGNRGLRTVALLAGTGIGVLQLNGVYAAESAANAPDRDALEQVYVFGQKDAYKLDTSGLLKLAVPLIDVPQSINTISAQEMQDRAVMDLNTALHTVTWGHHWRRRIPFHRHFAHHPRLRRPDRYVHGRHPGLWRLLPRSLQSRRHRSPRRTGGSRVRPRFDRWRDRTRQQTAEATAAHSRNAHRWNRQQPGAQRSTSTNR